MYGCETELEKVKSNVKKIKEWKETKVKGNGYYRNRIKISYTSIRE